MRRLKSPDTRTQYPLILSWALTIHKAQGMTLNRSIVNLSNTEFSAGLTYTACTRVRKLSDMAFDLFPNFYRQDSRYTVIILKTVLLLRIQTIFKKKAFKERLDEELRKLALYQPQTIPSDVQANTDVYIEDVEVDDENSYKENQWPDM